MLLSKFVAFYDLLLSLLSGAPLRGSKRNAHELTLEYFENCIEKLSRDQPVLLYRTVLVYSMCSRLPLAVRELRPSTDAELSRS